MLLCKNHKFLICSLVILLYTHSVFAQAKPSGSVSMPEMPAMPEVSMPSMPTMDSSYYKPQLPGYNNQRNTNTQATTQNKTQSTTQNTAAATSPSVATSILKGNSGLSAMDITSLYEAGLFDDFSSLTGQNNNQSVSTNVLLQQILTSLEELKIQANNASDLDKSNLKNTQKDSQNFKQREPAILRFKVNGYVITDSLTTVFFSSPEPDGSFLLTADRVYYLNQTERHETIYLLFKVSKHNGSTTIFSVVPTLMQDKENQNSFLYKLCMQSGLEAQKTGNLVAVHCTREGFSLDLLLDIDK